MMRRFLLLASADKKQILIKALAPDAKMLGKDGRSYLSRGIELDYYQDAECAYSEQKNRLDRYDIIIVDANIILGSAAAFIAQVRQYEVQRALGYSHILLVGNEAYVADLCEGATLQDWGVQHLRIYSPTLLSSRVEQTLATNPPILSLAKNYITNFRLPDTSLTPETVVAQAGAGGSPLHFERKVSAEGASEVEKPVQPKPQLAVPAVKNQEPRPVSRTDRFKAAASSARPSVYSSTLANSARPRVASSTLQYTHPTPPTMRSQRVATLPAVSTVPTAGNRLPTRGSAVTTDRPSSRATATASLSTGRSRFGFFGPMLSRFSAMPSSTKQANPFSK